MASEETNIPAEGSALAEEIDPAHAKELDPAHAHISNIWL